MLRELVRRLQFSDDTTIDSNRLDGLMQAFIDRFNGLMPRDIERGWTETTLVTGYQPCQQVPTYATPVLPFMNVLNDSSDAPDAPSYYPTNKWRVRGTEVDGIEPQTSGRQRCWSIAFAITRPTILTGLSLTLRTDTVFPNDFQYGASPPPGYSNGDSVEDWQVTVQVDNPFTPEDRTQTNCEIQVTKRPAASWQMDTGAVVSDMAPAYPDGVAYPKGVFFDIDTHTPIPQGSRIRMNIVIPEYDIGTYYSGWDEDSYDRQFYSACISMLEKA